MKDIENKKQVIIDYDDYNKLEINLQKALDKIEKQKIKHNEEINDITNLSKSNHAIVEINQIKHESFDRDKALDILFKDKYMRSVFASEMGRFYEEGCNIIKYIVEVIYEMISNYDEVSSFKIIDIKNSEYLKDFENKRITEEINSFKENHIEEVKDIERYKGLKKELNSEKIRRKYDKDFLRTECVKISKKINAEKDKLEKELEDELEYYQMLIEKYNKKSFLYRMFNKL